MFVDFQLLLCFSLTPLNTKGTNVHQPLKQKETANVKLQLKNVTVTVN